MDKITCEIRFGFAWWFKPYVALLKVFVVVTHRRPSDEHIDWISRKAARVTIVAAR